MRSILPIFGVLAAAVGASAQLTLQPPFDASYSVIDLGSRTGVPAQLGGLVIKADDTNVLLIGGSANGPSGALYAVPLVRGADGHISGFAGPATLFAAAAYNDGGVVYGPGGVLFLARWPVNELGQILPGSTVTDRVTPLAPLGVPTSHSSLNFVPIGFPGSGRFKLTTYGGGAWFDGTVSAAGDGTYDIVALSNVPSSNLPGGPEGFTYVTPGSPLFTAPSMLLSEYGAGAITAYELDSNGDPIIASRRVLLSGLGGAEGAATDPVTGDFLFSTFGGGSRVVIVTGFNAPPCRADFNADGLVFPDDLSEFITCFFLQVQFPGFCPLADFNGDGLVFPDDLSEFITTFFLAVQFGC